MTNISPLRALLLAHDGPGREQPLRETYGYAEKALEGDLSDEAFLRTLKRSRVKAQAEGYMITRRSGKHFVTLLTDDGWAWLEGDDEAGPTAPELPGLPYRVTADHQMPKRMWLAMLADVKAGRADLLIVKPGTAAKVLCWDAEREDGE